MNLRHELRGVRKPDLVSAVLLIPALAFAGYVMAKDAEETRVPVQETQVQETQTQDEYKAVWEWCGVRFPYREDLQEACKWGAYKMLPGEDVPADEGAQDA